ncbi:MAG: glycosyltransferase, partial [Pyrinomonadaceae bacterium]|nr:glycosyltransferase [Pyrinomonadaceae bacterium]
MTDLEKKPIKSVHLTNYYHKNSGGISTSYNNLLAAASRHKRSITLIVPGETEEIEIVNDFAKIYYIPAKQSPIFDKRYRMLMPWQYMLNGSRIREIMLAEKPDMVEVTDKYTISMMGAMIRLNKFNQIGRPMLVHFSCERMDDNIASFLTKGKIGKWFSKRVMGDYVFPSFDYHIANSTYTAEEFYESVEKNFLLNPAWRLFKSATAPIKERVFVCPRGVNIEQFSHTKRDSEFKKSIKTENNLPENAIILLYTGRISPEKNVELLPEFMKILAKDKNRDFRLLVAGAGPQSDWLKAETEANFPDKIIQLGHLDKEKLSKLYANCDIFVHPNPREPFGIAPLEAMASGVPVVAPNAGGILSYATDENCWLVEPKAEHFAWAIRDIVENDELRKRKVEKAIETAQ